MIPAKDQYIALVVKFIRRSTATCLTSMPAAAIGKTISDTSVRQKLCMSGLLARVPKVCAPLYVQSIGA